MQHLIDSNPAKSWIDARHTLRVDLDSGRTLIIKMGITQKVVENAQEYFSLNDILKHHHSIIIPEPEHEDLSFKEMMQIYNPVDIFQIAQNVADTANQALVLLINTLEMQYKAANMILKCIEAKKYDLAREGIYHLGVSFIPFEPKATEEGWYDWVLDCIKYIEAQEASEQN